MTAQTKTERVLRDVLNSDNLRDFLGGGVVNNAMKWRFLQASLVVLDGHGLLGDPAGAVKEATPAPLDPSKVKAGDTVTLEKDGALVRDVVIEAKSRGVGQFVFYTAENPDPLIPGTYYLVNHGAWTLTAHQPAPEPEPEWKPGTVADIEVDGGRTYRAIRNDGDQWDAENAWTYGDSEVTDVRPLVVIDPAAVDVVELAKAAWDRWDGLPATESSNAHFRDVVRAVLSHLGLDGAR